MKKLITIFAIIFLLASTLGLNAAKKKVLIESFTGTWCGPCGVYGKPATAEVLDTWPNDVYITELHVGQDPFVIPESSVLLQSFGISGIPSGVLNRQYFMDQNQNLLFGIYPTYWKQVIPQLLAETAPCEVNLLYSINSSTRQLTATITAEFTDDYEVPAPAELRFNVYLNENHIPYYQNGQGDNYDHKHVCRKMFGGAWGTEGIIPNSVKKGDVYTHTYTVTLDPNWNIKNLELFGVVNEFNTQYADYLQILNVEKGIEGGPKSELTTEGALFNVVPMGNNFDKIFQLKNISNENITFEITLEKSARTPGDWTTGLKAGSVTLKATKKDGLQAETYEVEVNKNQTVNLTLTLTPNSIGIGDVTMTVADKYDDMGQKSKASITALTKEAKYFEITDYKDSKYQLSSIVSNKLQDIVPIMSDEYDQYNYLLDDVEFVIWNSGDAGTISAAEASTINNIIYDGVKVIIFGTSLHNLKQNAPSLLTTLGIEYLKPCFKGYGDGKIHLEGFKDDPISNGFDQACQLISYLTPAFKVTGNNTYPVLKHKYTDTVVAIRSIVNNTRVALFGITPYVITNTSARDNLISKAIDWVMGVGPNIETASTLSFDDTKVGETSTKMLTIQNTGKNDLVISNIEVQYDFSHIFKVTSETSFSIPGGGSKNIEIEFKPAYAIEYESWIKIYSNAENEPIKTVSLSGNGLSAVSVVEYNINNILQLNLGPNPVTNNAKLKLTFNAKTSQNIELYIVDLSGQKLETIANEVLAPGTYSYEIKTNNLSSGKYFIIGKSKNAISEIPMTVVK